MEQPLRGQYKVSFNIDIESDDALNLSDLSFLLTEGVGEGLAAKLSHLSVEKIEKTGKTNAKLFKIGDKIQINQDIKIQASIYEDDGYMFIGEPTESANMIGEQEVTISAGSIGYVNKDRGENIQIVDLDLPVVASLIDVDTDEVIEAKVNVDFITLSSDMLEKVDSEGGK
jgi:hypothetical protein